MLIIRFARFGKKKSAFFKLMAAEKTRAVQKKFIKELGWYNPHTENGKGEFKFDAELVKQYIGNGAQVSQTAARKLVSAGIKEAGKFIKARSTKPKKEEIKEATAPETESKEEVAIEGEEKKSE